MCRNECKINFPIFPKIGKRFPSPSGGLAPSAPTLGAFGAPVGAPAAPILETAAFGGGERKYIKLN